MRLSAGEIYNGDQVQKTTDALTKEVAKRGYAFSQVRPRGDRDPVNRTVAIVFVIDEGPRVYIERIVIRGNTRTRDYVIRREFDIGEGDAYNKAIIDRAERRLNNLGYFKKVKITNEQGSTPDRVIIDGRCRGSADRLVVAVRRLFDLGRISSPRSRCSEPTSWDAANMCASRSPRDNIRRGVEFNFTEPYFLGNRLAAGFDLYAKQSSVNQYSFYNNFVTGGTLRFGLPITDEITFSPRYSIYNTEFRFPNNSTLPYNDCNSPIYGDRRRVRRASPYPYFFFNCLDQRRSLAWR